MSAESKDCNNCKYEYSNASDLPCKICYSQTFYGPSKWEPKDPISIKDCRTCANAVTEEGCRSCNTFNLWEEAQDLNTYEVSVQGKKMFRIKAHSKFGVRNLLEAYLIDIEEI